GRSGAEIDRVMAGTGKRHGVEIDRRNAALHIRAAPIEALPGDCAGEMRLPEGGAEGERKAVNPRSLKLDRQAALALEGDPIVDTLVELRGDIKPIGRVPAEQNEDERN